MLYNCQLFIPLVSVVVLQCFIKRLKGRIPDYDVIFLGIEVRKAPFLLGLEQYQASHLVSSNIGL